MGKVTLIGRPAIVKEFNGLRTITRNSKVQGEAILAAAIETDCFIAYGTADVEFTTALLVDQSVETLTNEQNGLDVQLVQVFKEFTDATLVNVGTDLVEIDEDGFEKITKTFVCKASQAEGLRPAIGAVVSGKAVSGSRVVKQGVGAQVIITYKAGGILSQTDDTSNNGKLLTRTVVAFNTVPATPAGYYLTRTAVSGPSGTPTYTYTFVKGTGVISKHFQLREGGLRIETWVSLGQAYDSGTMKPDGVLALPPDEDEIDGGKRFTVSCYQKSDGSAVATGVALSYTDQVEFEYPGRAKAYTKDIPSITPLGDAYTAKANDLFRSPPVRALVDATVEVSYKTTAEIGALAHTLWNPTEWATLEAAWIGWNASPRSTVEPLYRYRAVGSPVTFNPTSHTSGHGEEYGGLMHSCLGERVFNLTEGYITVYGGPAAPDGNTYTLRASLSQDPAFVAADGTQYWRLTVIYATIPAQAALPV